jgi:predicted KAP-like P-loop ATPase
MDIKCKVVFNIKIITILIIHVAINLSENHIKKYGWILRKKWTHNWLLKWWHYVCHVNKMKNVDLKNMS